MADEKQYLYEDLYGDIKHMLNLKKRNLDINNVNLDRSDSDEETITTNSNYNNGKMNIDEDFCKRLGEYLEMEINKSFPNQTKLKSVLIKELRKIVKSGNDKELLKVAEKIRDIILKEKIKFFDNVSKRVAKVLINKY
jgi:hypothetical protein